MSSREILVIAKFTAQAGKADELSDAIKRCIEPSRAEAGNVHYDLYRSVENRHVFIIHETWKNRGAIDFHFEQSHFKTLIKETKVLISCEPVISTISL